MTLMGKFLRVAEKNKGGGEKGVGRRGKQCSSRKEPHSKGPTKLSESGISKKESAVCQKLAVMAEKAERDENTCREDSRILEALELGERLEKLMKPEAEKRKALAGPASGKGKRRSGVGKLPAAVKGRVSDAIAEVGGVSRKTYEKIKAVVAAAKALDKLADALN